MTTHVVPAAPTPRDAPTHETYVLSAAESSALRSAAEELRREHRSTEDEQFLLMAPTLAAALPGTLLRHLHAMRRLESTPALLVRDPYADPEPGPTPSHWRETDRSRTLTDDFRLLLLATQLGDPFSWSSLQQGRLVTDILPIRGREDEQTGHSSDTVLDYHVEDAFRSDRCDYLGLLCLRNDDQVATTLAALDVTSLTSAQVDLLFQPRFVIRPDTEHLRNLTQAQQSTPAVWEHPVAVLFGSRQAPYLRLDPPYMSALPGDEAAREALDALCRRLSASLTDVPLVPGDILLVDNYRAVHGRRPFRARYDGTDRWLRRTTISRDLRRSRPLRSSPLDPVVRY
ncbi:guanitoxin biosynthesis L-enduracididine beta-hydroxylase GntD [Streptomyces sp. NPDC052020]|uniref:guanitoxin biosynthesis L-enduracididine beta-hydroxylase GntD n=1 Tax=Streptomyces sp. NPDC052020 TaxID=3155677 RepID=UPI00341B01D9